jgi:hypothetical protein
VSIFSPYQIIKNSDGVLHLKESNGRIIFMFVFFRIFPLVLLLLAWKLSSVEELPINFRYALIPLFLLIALLLFFKSYVSEIIVSRQSLELRSHQHVTINTKIISLHDVNRITVKEHHGRGGGYFYKLELKRNKTIIFFTIPALYMKKGKLQQINSRLNEITGLEIQCK